MWVELEDESILVNTAKGRAKLRNVRKDPLVAISIADRNNPYSSAFIRERVVKVEEKGADELIDRLAKKYLGQELYPWRRPGERRVTLVIEPDQVSSMMVE